jgi:uncharacterized phage protein gp47/JayE
MNLTLKTFSQIVEDMGASLQSSATALIDVSVGSITRALFEANAAVALWIQWLILQVLQTTRAATSTGPDLDSWMADFALTRLPAIASTGTVTFSRFSTTVAASIPAGATVKTSDGSLTFVVTSDSSLTTFQASLGSYVIPPGVANIDLPVACTTAGYAGNVLASTVTIMASAIPGIDRVNNQNAMIDGSDSEADAGFRTRFVHYLGSLSRATPSAIINAASSVQQGLSLRLLENTAADGTSKPGCFLVIVDDGSGYPSNSLITNVVNAIEAVRPVGTYCSVLAPTVILANITLTVHIASNTAAPASLTSDVSVAITTYLNTVAVGRSASVTRIAACTYGASDVILNVTAISLNGTSQDLIPGPTSVIKAGQIVVTVNSDE